MGGAVVTAGDMLAGETVKGCVMAGGKPLAGVVVTDGHECAESRADGSWTLPGRSDVRFISITVPSGWKVACHYRRFEGAGKPYDFTLEPWPASAVGPFAFQHVGDSEIGFDIEAERPWVARVKNFSDERNCAFIVHTGDICTTKGDRHIRLMNSENMGRPVYYVIGNHDVIAPERGEEAFERFYGPCWYSFDCGGVHFVVTPMMWGDGKPSYGVDEIVAWLRNDLAIAARKGQPVMHLVHGPHDNGVFDTTRLYEESKVFTAGIDRFEVTAMCDFRAIVHGHFHSNYLRRSKDRRIEIASVAQPQKGPTTLQVVHVGADRKLRVENRYGLQGKCAGMDDAPKGGWIAKVDGIVNYGAPCVANGRVMIGTIDFEGRMPPGAYAFDAFSGKKIWEFQTQSDVSTRLLNFRGITYVQDIDWRVSALDERTGRVVWTKDLRRDVGIVGAKFDGGSSSTLGGAMTIDPERNRLYVGSALRQLVALDPANGEIVWRPKETRSCFLSTPSCTVACGDTVVGGVFWEGLYGYDAETGERLWRHGRNNSADTETWYKSGVPWIERFGFPVYRDGKLYIASHEHFFEVEPRTGRMLRQKVFPFSVNCYHQPLFVGDRAYFGSVKNGLVCVDMKTFDLLWTAPVEEAQFCAMNYIRPPVRQLSSAPALWKGLVWASAPDGAIYAWDPRTGERRERIFTGAPYVASVTVAENRLYAADFTGRLRCFV